MCNVHSLRLHLIFAHCYLTWVSTNGSLADLLNAQRILRSQQSQKMVVVQLNAFEMHKAMQWRLLSAVADEWHLNEKKKNKKKGVKMPIAQKPSAPK